MPYADNDGVQIYYEIEGDGLPLVLVGGAMGRAHDWRREDVAVAQALRAQYRLILIDQRGLGRSDKPHEAAAYALEARVRDVTAVLDAETVARAHFWGYSRGGVVGLGLGVHAPGRCRALIVGGVDPGYVTDRADSLRMAAELRRGSMADHLARHEARNGPLPPDERADFLANDPVALAAMREATANEPGLAEAVTAIPIPLLLYAGEHDPTCVGARRAAALIPGATFVSLAGCDHAQTFRNASALLPHVRDFLAQQG